MKIFQNSITKIIDYPSLASFLDKYCFNYSTILDIGSGDCSLISTLASKYKRQVLGIDIDEQKVEYAIDQGFDCYLQDIRSAKSFICQIPSKLTIHSGFCLFNIFSNQELDAIFNTFSKVTNVEEIIFEIQNSDYFALKYLPFKKYEKEFNGLTIISWHEPIEDIASTSTMLFMEYYTQSGDLINKTKDRLYNHDQYEINQLVEKYNFHMIAKHKWPIRGTLENSNSHFYYQLRKKND